jgi:hypothetical protein
MKLRLWSAAGKQELIQLAVHLLEAYSRQDHSLSKDQYGKK